VFELMCSGKQIWCYGTWDSCAWQTWHYGTWSSCALAHKLDAALLEVPVQWHSNLMLRYLEVYVRRYTWWYQWHVYIYIYLLQICLQVSRRHANLQIDDRMRGYFVSKNMFETIQRVFFFKGKGIVHVPCTVQQLKRLNFASILTTVHW